MDLKEFPMAKKKLSIALIGAGMVGDFHINGCKKDGRAEVTWIAARTQKTLKEKLAKHNIPNGTTNYKDILKDDSVDAVIIAAPPFLHLQMAKDVLNAGKHLLLEKPLVVNSSQLNTLLKLTEKHKDKIISGCSARHARLQPKFHAVKKLIDTGAIGEVYHIHHNHVMRSTFIEYNPKGTWSLKKELAAGGPFVDWGVYDLSFHLGVLGDKPNLTNLRSFTKTGLKRYKKGTPKPDIEEHGAAWMQFDTALTYYYERGSGARCEVANETRIYGTKGSLRFSFCSWDPPEIEHFYLDKAGREKHAVRKVDMSNHPGDNEALAAHFIDCLLGKAKPMMPISLAAKHLDILFKILKG